jgi:hypothetical protein
MQARFGTVSINDTGWSVKELKILGGPIRLVGEKFYYFGHVQGSKPPPMRVFETTATVLASVEWVQRNDDVLVYLITRDKNKRIRIWQSHIEDLDDGFPILFINNEVPRATFGSSWDSDSDN